MLGRKNRKRTCRKNAPSEEVCVLCGYPTGERKETPVSERKYYAPGCGSLCQSCYLAYYKAGDATVSVGEIERLLTLTKNKTE